MEHRIRVRRMKPSQTLIFRQHRAVYLFHNGAVLPASTKSYHLPELVLVQHRDFHFAAPAPEEFHLVDGEGACHEVGGTSVSISDISAAEMSSCMYIWSDS